MSHFYTQFALPTDADELAWHVAGLLVAHHGVLPEAIAGLRWPDVAFTANQLALLDPRTAGSRTMTMAHPVRAALLRWQAVQRLLAETHRPTRVALANPDSAYVLLDQQGQPVKPAEIMQRLKWLRHARIAAVAHQLDVMTTEQDPTRSHPSDCPVCVCSGVAGVHLQRLADLLEARHMRRSQRVLEELHAHSLQRRFEFSNARSGRAS